MTDHRIVKGGGGATANEASISEAGNIVLADAHIGATTLCNKGAAGTITVPSDATNNYPIGTKASFIENVAGKMTVTAGASAVVHGRGGLVGSNGLYSKITIEKVAANTWYVFGDIA